MSSLLQAGRHPHPERDWFILLALATLLTGVSVGWNVWIYTQVTKETVSSTVQMAPQGFSTTTIGIVEQVFSARKDEAERYHSVYRFVDPSR